MLKIDEGDLMGETVEISKGKMNAVLGAGVLLVITLAFLFSQGVFTGSATTEQKQAVATAPSGEVQEITIKVGPTTYSPDYIEVKKDIPVRLTLQAEKGAGCTRSFVFPEYKIRKTVPVGGTEVVEFTPTKAGTFQFSCSMNMARGKMAVK